MSHNPEAWWVLDHLLQFSNIGSDADAERPGGTFSLSPRYEEEQRIGQYRAVLSSEVTGRVLADENSTYDDIANALSIELQHLGVPDEQVILHDALSVILDERRNNIERSTFQNGNITGDGDIQFADWRGLFLSRLWPADNPPWYYPAPSILWHPDIPIIRIETYRNRAIYRATELRLKLLELPLTSTEDKERAEQEYNGHHQMEEFVRYYTTEWSKERLRYQRSISVLETYVTACNTVIEERSRYQANHGTRDRYASTEPRPQNQVEEQARSQRNFEHIHQPVSRRPDPETPIEVPQLQQISQEPLVESVSKASSSQTRHELSISSERHNLRGSTLAAFELARNEITTGRHIYALAHLHTVVHGILQDYCQRESIPLNKEQNRNAVQVFKQLFDGHPALSESRNYGPNTRAIRGQLQKILTNTEGLRDGMAHPNHPLPTHAQAMLTVNAMEALVEYIDNCVLEYQRVHASNSIYVQANDEHTQDWAESVSRNTESQPKIS